MSLHLPLVPLAGAAGAGVAEATPSEDKLIVLESHAAGHTGAGIRPPVRGTHRDEAVRAVTGKAWGEGGH